MTMELWVGEIIKMIKKWQSIIFLAQGFLIFLQSYYFMIKLLFNDGQGDKEVAIRPRRDC